MNREEMPVKRISLNRVSSRWLAAWALLMVVASTLLGLFTHWYANSRLEIFMSAPEGAKARVLFDTGKGYRDKYSFSFDIRKRAGTFRYSISLPHREIREIRIHPSDREGSFSITSLSFLGGASEYELQGKQLKSELRALNHVRLHAVEGDAFVGMAVENEPYLQFSVNPAITKTRLFTRVGYAVLYGLIAAILAVVLISLVKYFDRIKVLLEPARSRLEEIGVKISEPQLIRYDWRAVLFLILSFCLFTCMVTFKLHLSSLDVWNRYVAQPGAASSVVLGKAKGIRSDEWLVYTPFILSQVRRGLPAENAGLGDSKTPLLMALPTLHYSLAFQPRFWGFLFLGPERGFSFFWAYKVVGTIVSFFLLFMLLTNSRFWLSVSGSFWVYLSSYTQWWFSSNMPEVMIAFAFIVVSFVYVVLAKNKISMLIGALALVLLSINYVLLLYPPFQIPLVYLGFFVASGYLIQNVNKGFSGSHIWARISCMLFALTVIFSLLLGMYKDAQAAIALVMQTEYPGRRLLTGGSEHIWRMFSGFYDMFYFGEGKFPSTWGNVCEASNFVLFYPFVAIAGIRDIFKRKRINYQLTLIMAYLIIMTLWMTVGFPDILARVTLLSHAGGARAYIGLGLASIIATITYFTANECEVQDKRWWVKHLPLYGPAFLLLFLLGLWLRSKDAFFTIDKILAVSIVGMLAIRSIYTRSTTLFLLCTFVFILPGWLTNPIAAGLNPVYGKELSQGVGKIFEKDPDAKWLTFGKTSHIIANFLKASGLNVFNGVHYIPDLHNLKMLDEAGRFSQVYNRYAHIILVSDITAAEPRFDLQQADLYTVTLNPCTETLRRIGIKYAAFTYEPSAAESTCMEPVSDEPCNGTWLFRYKWATHHHE